VFAGLEDMLYAQASYERADSPEQAVSSMLVTVWLRAMTTFVGHGVWTGLICAAIWRGKGTGAPRWDWQVLGAYLFSSLLHGLWDWSPPGFMVPVGLVGTLLRRGRIQRASEAEQRAGAALALAAPSETALAAEEQAATHCPVCGLERARGSRYCVRCGAALTVREPASS